MSSPARSLAQIAIFAALIAVLGLIPAFTPPGMPVPITVQTMGVMLAGAILGSRKGFAAVVLFLALVAIGLPLISGGRGGLGIFVSPSVGFFLAWPFSAFIIGWLTERRGAPYRVGWGILDNVIGGIVFMYVIGTIGIMIVTRMSLPAAIAATAIFIPGDIVKAVLAALIAKPVHAAYPGLLKARDRARDEVSV